MDYTTWFWIIVMIILILIEVFTVNLTTIWFACGACIAVFVSVLFPDSIIVQIIAFIVVSAVLVTFTRPLAKKISRKTAPTNADRSIGEKGVVVEKINNLLPSGQVKVLGQVWTARSCVDEVTYDIGDIVKVEKIEGVKLIVSAEEKAVNKLAVDQRPPVVNVPPQTKSLN